MDNISDNKAKLYYPIEIVTFGLLSVQWKISNYLIFQYLTK